MSAEVRRRDRRRGDHRPVNADPVTVATIDAYSDGASFVDWTVESGVEYQYQPVVTGADGGVTVGAWTPA